MAKKEKKHIEDVQVKKKGSAAGAVVGTLVNILMIAAIIISFFCTYTAYVTKKGSGVPNILGYEPFSIQTDSMSPFFNAGDLIIDKTVKDVNELKVGDVITFWTIIEGERVLNSHRIIDIVDADTYIYFVTKGDNNTIEDSMTVHQSEVVGKYWTKIGGLGSVLDFLQTSKGFFCVIVLPVAAFFIYYLVNFFKVLFEYQAAKNRLKFEEEQEALNGGANGSSPAVNMTQEQLLELLAKAQATPAQTTVQSVQEDNTGEENHTEVEKIQPEKKEPEKEFEKVTEQEPEKEENNNTNDNSATISLSKEELEAMIAEAVKKAKKEEE